MKNLRNILWVDTLDLCDDQASKFIIFILVADWQLKTEDTSPAIELVADMTDHLLVASNPHDRYHWLGNF